MLEGQGGSGSEAQSYTTIRGWQYGLRTAAANVISDNFEYDGNTVGVLLNGAVNNNINDFGANNNTTYGIWIKNGSTNNKISASADNNGIAGVYMGCSATGPSGSVCAEKEDRSTHNYIYYFFHENNVGYGIALELGSRHNVITDTYSLATSVTPVDLYDANPSCDRNIWRANSFKAANRSCIQ